MTVSDAVKDYIKARPFLQSSINQGIISLSSLTRVILPDLEKTLKKPVKAGAVMMALKRVSEEMQFKITHKIVGVLRKIEEITVRSELTDYAFSISDSILQNQARLIKEINSSKGVFYTSSRGVEEMNVIISSKFNPFVEDFFSQEKCIQKLENVAAITVRLPEENTRVAGVYYFMFHQLAWENIAVNEVISTSNEFTIVVEEVHLEKAFKAIKSLKYI